MPQDETEQESGVTVESAAEIMDAFAALRCAMTKEQESAEITRVIAAVRADERKRLSSPQAARSSRSSCETCKHLASPLTDFIDKMSQAALDDGTMGQHDEAVKIKHGEKSPLETW